MVNVSLNVQVVNIGLFNFHMERTGDEYQMQGIYFMYRYWYLSYINYTELLVFALNNGRYLVLYVLVYVPHTFCLSFLFFVMGTGPFVTSPANTLSRPSLSWDLKNVHWTDGKGAHDYYTDADEWCNFHDLLDVNNSNKIGKNSVVQFKNRNVIFVQRTTLNLLPRTKANQYIVQSVLWNNFIKGTHCRLSRISTQTSISHFSYYYYYYKHWNDSKPQAT